MPRLPRTMLGDAMRCDGQCGEVVEIPGRGKRSDQASRPEKGGLANTLQGSQVPMATNKNTQDKYLGKKGKEGWCASRNEGGPRENRRRQEGGGRQVTNTT